jgi:hypothetical protein
VKVLALDPGERVGWATGVIEDGFGIPGTASLTVTDHGMAYLKDMALAVYRSVVLEKKYDVVVYERWTLTPKGAKVLIGNPMAWCQFIGMVRLCGWISGTKVVGQYPAAMRSARKSATGQPCGADVLERVAKADSVSHDDGHDGSALLHLWHYYFEKYV